MPMLQTMMEWRALPNASANRIMSERVRPELLSSVSQERLRTLASVSLQPLVRRLMKSRSIQSHSMRCLSTPEKKAMSPPA